MKEAWAAIVGWEGLYEVSNIGNVRSMSRTVLHSNGRKQKRRGQRLRRDHVERYMMVRLCRDGGHQERPVHQLVLESFVGPCPEGNQVNHKDGIKTNNEVSNLEYVTPSQNVRHSIHMGLRSPPQGEKNGASKLTKAAVLEIRKLLRGGRSTVSVANDFGVSRQAISDIKHGKKWGHLLRVSS